MKRLTTLLLLLSLASPAAAFPTARAGPSLADWGRALRAGHHEGLQFHPWLSLETVALLRREGVRVTADEEFALAVGSIAEDLDLAECSDFPPYAELSATSPVPGELEIAASALRDGQAALERRLGFPLAELAERAADWRTWLRVAISLSLESERVGLLREALAGYPSHRAENHFLAAPGQRFRGLHDSPEFVLLEHNVSLLEWTEHPRNTCGLPALRAARAAGDDLRAWRLMGHALHLLQDAAVPAHVRNDTHAPLPHPARFLASLVGPLQLDLRGDQSFDWFDPLEERLSLERQAFAEYRRLVGSARLDDLRAAAPRPLAEAIEEMGSFVRGRYYSRDTIRRERVGGVLVGEVSLRDERLRRAPDGSWCLHNRWDERVACATEASLRAALSPEANDRVLHSPLPLPPEALESLTRGGALQVTEPCIEDYLVTVIPRLIALSAGVVRHELERD